MRRLLPLAALLTLAAARDLAAQRAKLDSIVRSTTLENGLEVVVVRIPTIPYVTLQMVFRAGAFIQPTEQEAGYAHYIEHLLFRREGNSSLDTEAAKIDAVTNGVTDAEAVRYYFVLPSKKLEDGIELMAKMVRKPSFTAKALEEELPIVRGELERRASDPDLLLRHESDQQLWGLRVWDSKSIGGSMLALARAKPAALQALYARYYVPNNAALIISGDVVDTVAMAAAAKAFKGWKRGPDPLAGSQSLPVEPMKGVARKVITGQVKDVTFMVRWHGPNMRDTAASYAADVFAGLVNQPISRTRRRLVHTGLFDGVSISYQTQRDIGPITLMARTSPDRAVAAAAALGDEIRGIAAADYFDAEDMQLAKKYQSVAAHFELESAMGASESIASSWSAAGLDYYVGYFDKLAAQTEADVRRFVATYITGKPMAVVVMAPSNDWTTVGAPLERALSAWTVP